MHFVHIVGSGYMGGYTLAVMADEQPGMYNVALAPCPKDKEFEKTEGRSKAKARMRVGLYKVFDATSLMQYVRELVAKIDGTFPHEELRAALASS